MPTGEGGFFFFFQGLGLQRRSFLLFFSASPFFSQLRLKRPHSVSFFGTRRRTSYPFSPGRLGSFSVSRNLFSLVSSFFLLLFLGKRSSPSPLLRRWQYVSFVRQPPPPPFSFGEGKNFRSPPSPEEDAHFLSFFIVTALGDTTVSFFSSLSSEIAYFQTSSPFSSPRCVDFLFIVQGHESLIGIIGFRPSPPSFLSAGGERESQSRSFFLRILFPPSAGELA